MTDVQKQFSDSLRGGGGKLGDKRDSNIELYRIIVMLLIVSHHYVVNSGLCGDDGPIYANPLSARAIFLLLFGAWGKVGINCFVLITGYFMCRACITFNKFLKLFFEVIFYNIVIASIFWLSGYEAFSARGLLGVLFPVRNIGTGFTDAYIIFYLCIPFLNILIQNMSEKMHIYLLVLCGFTYVLLGTLPFFSVSMNYVSWFTVIYFIASYIRLYPKRIFGNARFWIWMSIVSVLLCAGSVVVCAWLGVLIDRHIAYYFVTDSNTFLAVFAGVCSFMAFKNIRINYNRFINSIAASTFGVLMIHANNDAMRRWLWESLFGNVSVYGKPWMPLHALGSVLLVFTVCNILDHIRIHMVEKPLFKALEFYFQKQDDG